MNLSPIRWPSSETAATTLCFALHPEIQHRLRTEIVLLLNKHNRVLTNLGIQEMAYLDIVV
jgi:hypothetical protein